jgi:hypothetical protein
LDALQDERSIHAGFIFYPSSTYGSILFGSRNSFLLKIEIKKLGDIHALNGSLEALLTGLAFKRFDGGTEKRFGSVEVLRKALAGQTGYQQ